MIIEIITIFPKMFKPVLEESIIKRGLKKGLVRINIHNLRDYSDDPHKKIDAPPYGGGPGMVFRPQPLFYAVESILGYKVYPNKRMDRGKRIILFGPKGTLLKQSLVKKYLNYERLILIAARYEGVDERVRRYLAEDEISIGDYVLSGGELAAMVFVDCLVRLIPGVVSDFSSIKEESFEDNLLDYPVYTRPRSFRGLGVPHILLSGDHKKIIQWRKKKQEELTKKLRPDLWSGR
jgi:tRNA (guanine37-N1)-methyltransferase